MDEPSLPPNPAPSLSLEAYAALDETVLARYSLQHYFPGSLPESAALAEAIGLYGESLELAVWRVLRAIGRLDAALPPRPSAAVKRARTMTADSE